MMAALSNDPPWRFARPAQLPPDIMIRRRHDVVLLKPLNDTADEWLDENLHPDVVREQDGYPVAQHDLTTILNAAREGGLKVGSR